MATSSYCPVGGMLIGDRAWTLQIHPEFSTALADNLLSTRRSLFGDDQVNTARATLSESLDQQRIAGWISRFFHQVA
jgi:GMP synthase-like glutamine amidotransferase